MTLNFVQNQCFVKKKWNVFTLSYKELMHTINTPASLKNYKDLFQKRYIKANNTSFVRSYSLPLKS